MALAKRDRGCYFIYWAPGRFAGGAGTHQGSLQGAHHSRGEQHTFQAREEAGARISDSESPNERKRERGREKDLLGSP